MGGFNPDDALDDAVSAAVDGCLSSISEQAASAWPQLMSVYVDVWLTDVEGHDSADFRFFKKNGQLLVNHCVDSRALLQSTLGIQTDAVVHGVLRALEAAFGRYGHERLGEAVSRFLPPAAQAHSVRATFAPTSNEGGVVVETSIFLSRASRKPDALAELIDQCIEAVERLALAHYEGRSVSADTLEFGMITNSPEAVEHEIRRQLRSAGLETDAFSIVVEDDEG